MTKTEAIVELAKLGASAPEGGRIALLVAIRCVARDVVHKRRVNASRAARGLPARGDESPPPRRNILPIWNMLRKGGVI